MDREDRDSVGGNAAEVARLYRSVGRMLSCRHDALLRHVKPIKLAQCYIATGHQAPVLQTPECGSKAIPPSHCAGSFFVLAKTINTTVT